MLCLAVVQVRPPPVQPSASWRAFAPGPRSQPRDIQGSTYSCVKLAAEHLNRSEEGHAEVLAEVEALRADLQLMRTQVGSAIGVDLVQP